MTAAATPVGRERGWGLVVLALIACLAVAAAPFWPPAAGLLAALVRAFVPVEQMLLLIVPAIAVCAAIGWWTGGRLAPALAWVILSAWVLGQPLPADAAGYAPLARGWSLLLAGSFGIVCLVGPRMQFLVRALSALGLACAIAVGALLATGRDPARIGDVMHNELSRRSDVSIAAWQRHAESASIWRAVAQRAPELAARADAAAERLRDLPGRTAPLSPALAGLESLAALGLAWGLYHRLSRNRIGPPLGALASFRFSDQLVWGLVAGVTIVILPSLAPLRAVGVNLLLFFGALYALRGLGILRWLATERIAVVAALAVALLWPVLGIGLTVGMLSAVALVVGLGDTWGDWRNRRARQIT